ncbi:hypothetical protein M3P36_09785 [Altererythrobacter sp. KTW20L]|uniref:hypothetical protein n=1 Tax=Altererythrobacter sp. KTW20L TaxID=2942210 RepID=UPI0020C0B07A|nr:hypothetical protein [Altererythrobacter sp. KTW20L]MCL6251328.1 hypothetical protein [Altererythrobacter sp. KTW20L]
MSVNHNPENQADRRPARIVHLLGGVRAIDIQAEVVRLQIGPKMQSLRFRTPKYEHLYQTLTAFGLTPIGVEFPRSFPDRDDLASDWDCFFPTLGFRVMDERQEWSNIRHTAGRSGDHSAYDIASRCVTYLDLLNFRLMQLSASYNRMLRSSIAGNASPGQLTSNAYMREIDAAVHAFVADAGSFRDLIAEIVWRIIIKGDGKVTRFSSFLKRAEGASSASAKELIEAGGSGGWIHNLSNLRNDIVHVAPVGRAASFHYCQVREVRFAGNFRISILHYPLLAANETVWENSTHDLLFTQENEAAIKVALAEYQAYVDSSIDGLQYAWQTIQRLAELLTRVRIETGLRGEMATITDKDLVGEITIHRSGGP